ncbi:MAG: acrylyl-CoA reductase (NADPH), partial [Glaciecola sp.]
MSELNTFKALLVEETANKQFTLNIVNRSVSDLPENDLLVNV